ncbi:hypothetical protein CRENBAI_019010 [Crenichthys baileyi]|uniref:Uncharacterized protein n=1 Tax=Crenichthys baileyi TaxID=28760 RepID=A0AAV9RLA2_9TELE
MTPRQKVWVMKEFVTRNCTLDYETSSMLLTCAARRLPTLSHGTPRRTKQAGRPAPPPKRSQISNNTAHCLAKTPSPEPGAPPTDRPDTEAMDRDPRKSQHQHQTASKTPTPAQIPTRRPAPSPGLRPQTANSERGCEKTPSLTLPA